MARPSGEVVITFDVDLGVRPIVLVVSCGIDDSAVLLQNVDTALFLNNDHDPTTVC